MSKEAMKLALEALSKSDDFLFDWHENESDNEADAYATARHLNEKAITALRQAIREAEEQAPLDAYDKAMAEQTVCDYCNHALYAGTKCKNCGRVTEQAAIKQDLTPEQPAQQEPVAYWIPKAEQFCIADPNGRPFAKAWEPLYTSPQPAQQKPLTDEQKAYFVNEIVQLGTGFVTPLFAIVEAIEKAARGKE